MSGKLEARVSHRFDATADEVYEAWLDPKMVRRWMQAALKGFGLAGDVQQIEIEARVGGQFLFSDLRDGKEVRHRGTYLELERPTLIAFTWIVDDQDHEDPSQVRLRIQPEESGCTATLVHELDPKWSEYLSQTEDGWARMLENVDRHLSPDQDQSS